MSELIKQITTIEHLSGHTNYRKWALAIKSAAQLGSVWEAINGTDEAISESAQHKADFRSRAGKAIGLITSTVSDTLRLELAELPLITYKVEVGTGDNATSESLTRENNADELWRYLKGKFEKKDGVSAILDYHQLIQTRFIDDGNLEKQLNDMQNLRSKCALNDFKFEDWQYAAHLLLALPSSDSFRHIKDHFLTTADPKNLDPVAIRARILELENRERAEASIAAANIIQAKPPKTKAKKR